MSGGPAETHTLATARPTAGPPPGLRVVVAGGPDAPRELASDASRALVGRASSNDLVLGDPTVSQFHVELVSSEDGVDVVDLGSHNGTRVGAILIARARIPFGAELQLGGTLLRVDRAPTPALVRSKATSFGPLVGISPAMRDVFAVLERLAQSDVAVLVEGAAGTGKTSAARALHEHGRKKDGPLVVLDCTALPAGALDTLLAGDASTPPLTEQAAKGTLLLDEVGELSLPAQAKLARALDKAPGVRVVSTSWRDLRAAVNRGNFREDLMARVAAARVRLPTLAERDGDVKPLVQHFLGLVPWDVHAARAIAPDALETVAGAGFPKNVRELRERVERLAMLAEAATITVDDVAFDRIVAGGTKGASRGADEPLEPYKEAKRTLLDEFERGYLARLLARAGTNVSRASALAGIERQTLRDLLKKHGLRSEDGE